jgi:8-oxo-dGTP diphosphatase
LVTRSKGETVFFGLGGKVEPGETELECLQREVREEVGCIAKNPKHFQTFEGQAHDPAKTIRTPCYLCELEGEIKPKAEIEEVAWIGKDYAEKGIRLAPMLKLHIVPTLIRHKLL